jgi:hypothetical protein
VAARLRSTRRSPGARVLIGIALGAACWPTDRASAQGLLQVLFDSGPPPGLSSYAPATPAVRGVAAPSDKSMRTSSGPKPSTSKAATPKSAPPKTPKSATPTASTPATRPGGRSLAFCVRLCDGRYFALPRHAAAGELCRSFCPAAQTKIFNGSTIETAMASDGTRYGSLKSALLYRARLVADCSCIDKGLGMARIAVPEDPTLRRGDIVATRDGLMAYAGGAGRHATFTPVSALAGLSESTRRTLGSVKVTPAPPGTVISRPALAGRSTDATGSLRRSDRRRAQASR